MKAAKCSGERPKNAGVATGTSALIVLVAACAWSLNAMGA